MAHPTSNAVVEFMTQWSEYRTRVCMAHPTSNIVVEFMALV